MCAYCGQLLPKRGTGAVYRRVGDEWVGWHASYEQVVENKFCYWDDTKRSALESTLKRVVSKRGKNRVGCPSWR